MNTIRDYKLSDVEYYIKFWRGDVLKTYPKDEVLEVHVMISYYRECMNLFNDCIDNLNNKYEIVTYFINTTCRYSKCPDMKDISDNAKITTLENLSYPNLNFIC